MVLQILVLLVSATVATAQNIYENITPNETIDIVKDFVEQDKNKKEESFVILDVRTKREFDAGHIENSIMIDFYKRDFLTKIRKLDKEKKYIIYCRTGNRSGKTLSMFEDLGFKEAYNVLGGIVRWKRDGFVLVR